MLLNEIFGRWRPSELRDEEHGQGMRERRLRVLPGVGGEDEDEAGVERQVPFAKEPPRHGKAHGRHAGEGERVEGEEAAVARAISGDGCSS